jgi:Sigma-70 factor, region 1.1
MEDDEPKALIVRPTAGLQQHGSGAEKVLSGIISDALTIARGRDIADTSARIRIGKYEFREQDYQQILIWAQEAGKTPEELVRLLEAEEGRFDESENPGSQPGGVDVADSPLLDLSDAAVKQMIKLAKKRGFVTYEGLNAVLPSVEVTIEQIENVLAMLNEMGINVIENEEEHKSSGEGSAEEAEGTGAFIIDDGSIKQIAFPNNLILRLDLSNVPAMTHLNCSGKPTYQTRSLQCSSADPSGLLGKPTHQTRPLQCSGADQSVLLGKWTHRTRPLQRPGFDPSELLRKPTYRTRPLEHRTRGFS